MIKVLKYFTDIHNNLKPYKKGDIVNFSKERNDYLIKHNYAEYIEQKPKEDKKRKLKIEKK